MVFSKQRDAAKLAKAGKGHLAYLEELDAKEYDIPDDTPERKIDQVLFQRLMADMEEHKKTCSGCTVGRLQQLREQMEEKVRDKVAKK